MTDKKLLENLSKLGVPLLAPDENVDVNQTLAEVVKSRDVRLWENFPALLVNAHRKREFNVKAVEKYFVHQDDRRRWRNLLKMSLALYPVMKKHFEFARQMEKNLSTKESQWVNEFRNKARMRTQDNFELENKKFSFSRLKNLLEDYLQQEALKVKKSQAMRDELSLEFALSQVFSSRQKELFNKKLNAEKFSKTEREYYSRTVKKKVQALANPDMHHLAQKLLE